MHSPLRIGLIGAGANTRLRHIPGFLALPGVELAAVCNRRPESTAAVANEFGIPRRYDRWQDLVADPHIDAVALGAWPYLHCPVTLACLEAGKHILTEARLSMNAEEARRMLQASQARPELVAQVVPSPFGLKGNQVMIDLISEGYLGELREVQVVALNAALADAALPLSWRQDASLSGFNMLTLGIVHETLLRWAPPPIRVQAQIHAHIASRIDAWSGVRRPVGTPDSVQAVAVLEGGARATYHLSASVLFGQRMEIALYGTEGVLIYDLSTDTIRGASRTTGGSPGSALKTVEIPESKSMEWRVEAEFVDAIRLRTPIRFTDFETGLAYMEFTEAVARSAEAGIAIELPYGDGEVA